MRNSLRTALFQIRYVKKRYKDKNVMFYHKVKANVPSKNFFFLRMEHGSFCFYKMFLLKMKTFFFCFLVLYFWNSIRKTSFYLNVSHGKGNGVLKRSRRRQKRALLSVIDTVESGSQKNPSIIFESSAAQTFSR